MDTSRLELDRFLRKDPNQFDQTKDAAYAVANPAPKRGDDALRKIGRPKGSEEDDGAPNVLTGTVITSCFIQTSALPSRIELEGNDLTFFDDTYMQGGKVIGDTSRLIFTHGSGKTGEIISEGFIMEKRASIYNTYDNVLSWYALPAKQGAHNFMFIGRSASREGFSSYVHSMHFAINNDTNFVPPSGNPFLSGVFEVEYFTDAANPVRTLVMGKMDALFPGIEGFSSVLIGGDTGVTVLGYMESGTLYPTFYIENKDTARAAGDILPNFDSTYDLGSSADRWANIYADNIVTAAMSISTLSVDVLNVSQRIHLTAQTGNYGSAGDLYYFNNGSEGLRMRISGGFLLQFQADIV